MMSGIAVVTKRKDPNYALISGYVPKDLAIQFKVACAANQLEHGVGVEKALELWLQSQGYALKPEPQTSEKPETFTDLVQQNYFALMNLGKINHARLNELSFGQKPNATELKLIASVLELNSEDLEKLIG
ncbi:hypothetical protein NDI39_10060 [Microcoleus sp. ZQ-A2]|nr:hypothetical protein [Microcoleus sp. FACHB-1]